MNYYDIAFAKIKRLENDLKSERKENHFLRKEVRILAHYLKRFDPDITHYGRMI